MSGDRTGGGAVRRLIAVLLAVFVLVGVPSVAAVAADPTGTISGTASLDRGNGARTAATGATVSAYYYPSRGYAGSVRLSSSGGFSITLPAGQYVLSAGADSDQPQVLPGYSGGAGSLADATALTVTAGQVTVTTMTLTLGGQVEMQTFVQPTQGGDLRPPDPQFTTFRFDRVDPTTGAILATVYPTFYVDGIPPADILSTALFAGTYNVTISSTWYVNGSREPTDRISFTGSVSGVVVQPGQISRQGQVVLQTDHWDQIPVYRFWSPVYRGHFYTTDLAERDAVIARMPDLWSYEGIAFWAFETQRAGTVPLYRFWSGQFHGHFYTADQIERDHVIATYPGTWNYEDVAFYVYPATPYVANTDSVRRFWGPTVRHHFYTASGLEAETIRRTLSNMWSDDGFAFQVPAHW